MPINNLNPGTSPNNGSGDPLRIAAQKINANFEHFNDLLVGLGSGEGGKSYATLADAQAVSPKPADGTVFQVNEDPDKTKNGYWKFDSTQTGGTKFLRAFYDTVKGSFLEPQYENEGGTGDRSALITTSASPSLSSINPSALINGLTDNVFAFYAVTNTNLFLKFDFRKNASKLITEIKWKQSNSSLHGVWKIQASNDDTNWIDVSENFTLGGAAIQTISVDPGGRAYRYFRFLGVSGSTSGSPYINEVEFKIIGTHADGIESYNRIPKGIAGNLEEAWFFNDTDGNAVKGAINGYEIDLDLPTDPNYIKTAKGIKTEVGLIQTPFLNGVRAVTIVYRTNTDGNSGFILSGGSASGSGVIQGNIAPNEINKVLGNGINWHDVDSNFGVNGSASTGHAYETNRGGWIAQHRGHLTSYNSIYGLGGRHSTTTSRCAEFETAMVFFWKKEPTEAELDELGSYIRKECKKINITLLSEDCEVKKDLYLILGESNAIGRSTLSNLSSSDLSLDLRKTVYIGQTGGGNGKVSLDKLEMGYNQQVDNLSNFGPEFGVAYQRRIDKFYSNGCIILNFGQGGSRIAPNTSGWNVNELRSAGLLYKALRQVWYTIQELQAQNVGFNNTIRVGFWIGLNDATSTTYAPDVATYQGYLQDFYDKLASVFSGYTVEMVLFRAHANDPVSNSTALANIRAASDNLATANANVTTIDTDAYGLEADGVHYDAAASKDMGIILHG